jgi:molecular chaperone HtpG
MNVEAHKETLDFQAEVQQILHLMVHSLYSNKEIFLRELISNASDAEDRLRFEALQNESLYEGDSELMIRVDFDKENRTITVADNGIGMTRDEVVENIGTVARSGTRQFLESLSGDQSKVGQLIGQFGVGFYSSFIVADKVTLTTRRAGLNPEHGVRWESDGQGAYTLETVERAQPGTEVVLHMREGEDEFLEGFRLRSVIRKFSDHVSFPVQMKSQAEGKEEYETVNKASALWMRPKKEINDEEYTEFYKHVAHDFEPPLLRLHNRVEGKYQYTSLLFIPSRAPFDLWDREGMHGVKLYVRRVFIMDDKGQLLPRYLRFVRGVIDSDDLPLNVSREILQHTKVIDSIRSASVKRLLDLLEDTAKDDPDQYQKFWEQFGRVMKEGPAEDFANRERIAKLLRFASTHTDQEEENVSLEGYVARMKDGQEKIYYVAAESFATARSSPHLEVFRNKGIEVLLLSERIDEWLVSHLTEFDGKPLQSVSRGALDLGKVGAEGRAEEKVEEKERDKTEEQGDLVEKVKKTLGEKVKDVRVSQRLTRSPSCLISDEHDISTNLERLLRAAGQEVPHVKPILEINTEHPLVKRLKAESDEKRFADLAEILFDQALLSEGGQLEDPAAFVHRLNELLLTVSPENV